MILELEGLAVFGRHGVLEEERRDGQEFRPPPDFGSGFEFTEKVAGAAPYLAHLYNYTFGGLLSMGFGGASISGLKYSAARLVSGITRSLFVEDSAAHFASLCSFTETEF